MKKIPVYAINLPTRSDRREHILNQFKEKPEFNLTVFPAIQHKVGAYGLRLTLQQIVGNEINNNDSDFLIFCEDDHEFTENYSIEILLNGIKIAQNLGADILSGGCSWFDNAVQVSSGMFWINKFNGMQFTVIFRKFYNSILSANFDESVITDIELSALSDNIFVLYPYISVQKEFGYSDVTSKNNSIGYVSGIFNDALSRLSILNKVSDFYKGVKNRILDDCMGSLDIFKDVCIPTYIINMKDREDRLEHVLRQFEDKPEFDIHIVEACKHKIGRVGLWNSFKKVIQLAIDNGDDVVVICEDDHTFTAHYNKNYLFANVFEAAQQNVEILNGGIGGFGNAIPTSANRYWVDWFWCTQFSVYFRPIFQKIIDYSFNDSDTADGVFSELTSHKNVLYPFISKQTDFGYSDVTSNNDKIRGRITEHFHEANEKMNIYHQANLKYLQNNRLGSEQ